MDINGVMKTYKIKIKILSLACLLRSSTNIVQSSLKYLVVRTNMVTVVNISRGKVGGVSVNNKDIYKRIFIRHKK